MRLIILLTASIFYVGGLFGQDCQTLDSLKSFHGITFGSVIKADLAKISHRSENDIFLSHEKLTGEHKSKYSQLFKFTYFSFSELAISINKSSQVLAFHLWSILDFIDSMDLANGKTPDRFSKFYNKLIELLEQSPE